MKRIGTPLVSLALLLVSATAAFASPAPNSAVIKTRIFNDCPGSTLNTTNLYPGSIVISDDAEDTCTGFANLHNWRFSEDGFNPAQFANGDIFRFGADITITGEGHGEAGLQVSPWWSPDVEGRMNIRTTDGEIACFGGVLPFYSFSANHGVFYTKGTKIHCEINYVPNANTETNPATIEYKILYRGEFYSSGQLPFTNFNPAEHPIYGSYGVMNMAQVGGHLQALWFPGQNQEISVNWEKIFYEPEGKPTPTLPSTWGRVKAIYR